LENLNIILFDGDTWRRLLPLTFTRPIADIRIGILTIRQKWEHLFQAKTASLTVEYLREKYPFAKGIHSEHLFINGSLLPTPALFHQIKYLQANQAIVDGDTVLALRTSGKFPSILQKTSGELRLLVNQLNQVKPVEDYKKINYLWDIFEQNDYWLRSDYQMLTHGRKSQTISSTNTIIGAENIFVEEGASIEGACLNASVAPIYVGKNATIMEGSVVRGGLAMCKNSVLKMGTKIYGATTLGPYTKVGGELNNVVIFGYTNKAHDGFLGNAVIGEWCNLGANTNNSNLKNNYGKVKVWNYFEENFINSDRQFCGFFMGDHSKCGINTMLNTGTVIGVSANIFGADFPPKYIPSFSWGSAKEMETYDLKKSLRTAELVMARRKQKLTDIDERILRTIFEKTMFHRERYANNLVM